MHVARCLGRVTGGLALLGLCAVAGAATPPGQPVSPAPALAGTPSPAAPPDAGLPLAPLPDAGLPLAPLPDAGVPDGVAPNPGPVSAGLTKEEAEKRIAVRLAKLPKPLLARVQKLNESHGSHLARVNRIEKLAMELNDAELLAQSKRLRVLELKRYELARGALEAEVRKALGPLPAEYQQVTVPPPRPALMPNDPPPAIPTPPPEPPPVVPAATPTPPPELLAPKPAPKAVKP